MEPSAGHIKLKWVIAVIAGLAVVCVGAGVLATSRSEAPNALHLIAAAAGFAAAEAAMMHLRFGHDRWSFTWSEVVLVVGLTALPAPWLVLVAPIGVAAAHLGLRRPLHKILFNASLAAVGSSTAALVFSASALMLPDGDSTASLMARLVAASMASWIVTTAAVSSAVAASQNVPFLQVATRSQRMNVVVWVGNTVMGCLVVGIALAEPLVLIAVPLVAVMLGVIYRGYLLALEERDTWERLQAVSHDLLGTDAERMAEVALDGALALLQAEFADLVLVEREGDRAGLMWSRAPEGPVERASGDPAELVPACWPRVVSERTMFSMDLATSSPAEREELLALGLTSLTAVPLIVHAGCLGMLRIGFRGPISLRTKERQVLETFANHISTAANAVRLFEQLRSLALFDELTGLPNRNQMTRCLDAAVVDGGPLAVLFLDLDRFKVVNDSLGHEAGDQVLREAACRLRAALPEGAIASRFGGDEFVVVWPGVGDETIAMAVASRLADALARPIDYLGSQLLLTASVGVVVTADPGSTSAGLLRDADAAMYLAKARGRERIELFTRDIRETAVRRLALENELRAAIDRDELVMHYQPIVRLSDRRPVGAEALLRWQQPDGNLVPTTEFVALAEETNLIMSLGAWVLNEAVGNLREWDRVTNEPLGVSVNLSAQQLNSPRLVDEVVSTLAANQADPRRVTFEVTESSLVDMRGEAVDNLRRLRTLGCTIALDDFGTGWSSLSYLQRLPVDCLKLDRSFVARLDEDSRDMAVVGSLVNLAHALGLVVVAEGVERLAQLELLVELGCDAAQGFLLQVPCASEEMLHQVARSGGCWPAPTVETVSLFRTA